MDRFAPALAQWLPRLETPERVLSTELLDSLWHCADLDPEFANSLESLRHAAVVLCVRHPCRATLSFLRSRSESHAAALLGLAMSEPERYARQIEKASLSVPPSPAVVLALIEAKGVEQGVRFAQDALPGFPGDAALVAAMGRLASAIRTLDWGACAEVAGELQGWDLKPCLPFVVTRLLDCLDRAGIPEIGTFASAEQVSFLSRIGIDVYGLCLRLAERLRTATSRDAALSWTILNLLDAQSTWAIPAELRLWLNLVSGDRIYSREVVEQKGAGLTFGGEIASTCTYSLFFTATGERREVSRLPWAGGERPGVFPLSIEQARRFAGLLVEKAAPRDPRTLACFPPGLQIEHRLIGLSYAGRAGGKE